VGLANLGSESETCVGSRVHLVGVFISFEKKFYQLPFTPPLSGSPYQSFKRKVSKAEMMAHTKNIFGGRICNKECPKALGLYNPSDPVSF
jgi:hypothetical protein